MQETPQEQLILTPVPALVAVLWSLEKAKGSPLTEHEVITARDNAACIAMPLTAHRAVVAERGYSDLDPENIWQEWLAFKDSLEENEQP